MVIPCNNNYKWRDQALILKFKSAHIEHQDQAYKINAILRTKVQISDLNINCPTILVLMLRFNIQSVPGL